MGGEIAAYAAGIMDGEGSFIIGCSKAGRGHVAWAFVGNTNLPMLLFMKEHFGGVIRKVDRRFEKPTNFGRYNKVFYHWILTKTEDLLSFLKRIDPYLVTKKIQAMILADFCRVRFMRGGRFRMSDGSVEYRNELMGWMRYYNRGVEDGI